MQNVFKVNSELGGINVYYYLKSGIDFSGCSVKDANFICLLQK